MAGRVGERALSTLVAVVLTLAVVVTLVSIVATWATGYLNMLLGRSGVMITIENVEFYENDHVAVTVMNKGLSDTEIKEVYINDEATSWSMTVGSTVTTDLKADQIGRITVLYDWERDTSYTVKVVTSGFFQISKEAMSPE